MSSLTHTMTSTTATQQTLTLKTLLFHPMRRATQRILPLTPTCKPIHPTDPRRAAARAEHHTAIRKADVVLREIEVSNLDMCHMGLGHVLCHVDPGWPPPPTQFEKNKLSLERSGKSTPSGRCYTHSHVSRSPSWAHDFQNLLRSYISLSCLRIKDPFESHEARGPETHRAVQGQHLSGSRPPSLTAPPPSHQQPPVVVACQALSVAQRAVGAPGAGEIGVLRRYTAACSR